ncbi:DUF1127 domain-containing protein [Bradyrhizobium sp. CCGB20]|uniref:DUF1127 domain-containing protein n=1 Tax=Bradyrhizobium sp. CCGB20 TaxID=2949633 RepID=UPI0020B251C9|nr:DUF1127 domain-containing protein [Bradyrhizobium sp. CCGB20]MCP3401350.1 DUF1127 domain-containing protein [Bradyrhizobium sp. CCGB20]
MTMIHGTMWLERRSTSTRHVPSLIRQYWDAFQARRERRRLRATLSGLNDRELMDIGTTRGEIDYVASNPDVDPRDIVNYSRGAQVRSQTRSITDQSVPAGPTV